MQYEEPIAREGPSVQQSRAALVISGSSRITELALVAGSQSVETLVTGCSHQTVIGWKWGGQCQSNLQLDNKFSALTSSGWGRP